MRVYRSSGNLTEHLRNSFNFQLPSRGAGGLFDGIPV
jgi:hypothetical protein